MGLLTIRLPGVGPYLRTTAFVSSQHPGHPPRPKIVYNVMVADVEVDLGCREHAVNRLLNHAQMYREQLDPRNPNFAIRVVPPGESLTDSYPSDKRLKAGEHYFTKEIAKIEEFIAALRDPDTRFLAQNHIFKTDPLYL